MSSSKTLGQGTINACAVQNFQDLVVHIFKGEIKALSLKRYQLMSQLIQQQLESYLTSGFRSPIVSGSNICVINLNLLHILRIMEKKRFLQRQSELNKLVQKLLHCAIACDETAVRYVNESDQEGMMKCIGLTRDCSAACLRAIKELSRNSNATRNVLAACEETSRECAEECRKYPSEECRSCAVVCEHCAEGCYSFSKHFPRLDIIFP
jgi:hypothetical protein